MVASCETTMRESQNQIEHYSPLGETQLTTDCGMPTADILSIKLLLNSIISTPDAQFMTVDIKNFDLNPPLQWYEYLRLKLDDIPEDVQIEYNLHHKATHDGWVYVEIRKGMYRLPQVGLLAQELLKQWLSKHGYMQDKVTPGLWKYNMQPIQIALLWTNLV